VAPVAWNADDTGSRSLHRVRRAARVKVCRLRRLHTCRYGLGQPGDGAVTRAVRRGRAGRALAGSRVPGPGEPDHAWPVYPRADRPLRQRRPTFACGAQMAHPPPRPPPHVRARFPGQLRGVGGPAGLVGRQAGSAALTSCRAYRPTTPAFARLPVAGLALAVRHVAVEERPCGPIRRRCPPSTGS